MRPLVLHVPRSSPAGGKANIRDPTWISGPEARGSLTRTLHSIYLRPMNHEPLGSPSSCFTKERSQALWPHRSQGLTVIPLKIYFRNGNRQGRKSPWRRQEVLGPPPGRKRTKEARREVEQSMYPQSEAITHHADQASVTQPLPALETDALVFYVFEESDPSSGRIAEIDKAAAGLLLKLAKSGELTGKMLESRSVHAPWASKPRACSSLGRGSASNGIAPRFAKCWRRSSLT